MAEYDVIFLLCFALMFATVSGECPNGWTRFDDSCYRIYLSKQIWAEAQFECEKHDAFLAVIETQQESANIHALVKEINLGDRDNVWIGLADVRRESVWVWENTKQNATFFDWAHGEPNQPVNKEEDCVMLYGKGGHQWADVACETHYDYLCERPLNASGLIG